jgi:hypothetical protein
MAGGREGGRVKMVGLSVSQWRYGSNPITAITETHMSYTKIYLRWKEGDVTAEYLEIETN